MAVNGLDGRAHFNASFPSKAASPPRIFDIEGFRITTQKLPILKAGPIEKMSDRLGITPPEMIFGDNFVAIEHPASKWGIKFDAFGALDRVDKTGEKRLKVAYSQKWQQSREDSHDNGIAILSCKVRVMPARLLLLCRFFMRLDNVLFRLRDTRVYVDYDSREVTREYTAREEEYEKVRTVLASRRDDVAAQMREPNQLVELLPIVDTSLEGVRLLS